MADTLHPSCMRTSLTKSNNEAERGCTPALQAQVILFGEKVSASGVSHPGVPGRAGLSMDNRLKPALLALSYKGQVLSPCADQKVDLNRCANTGTPLGARLPHWALVSLCSVTETTFY